MRQARDCYAEIRRLTHQSEVGIAYASPDHGAKQTSAETLQQQLDFAWTLGGYLLLAAYPDVVTDLESNQLGSDWVKDKIRAPIRDPAVADKVMPQYSRRREASVRG